MKRTKLINADVEFITYIRQKYPNIKDPERTRCLVRDFTKVERVKTNINEIQDLFFGKRKKR